MCCQLASAKKVAPRIVGLRVAMNLEQLLYPSPGGVGRYAAKLAWHLGDLGVEVRGVVARHPRSAVSEAWSASGLATTMPEPDISRLPRPVLYDSWHVLGRPVVPATGVSDLSHAPSLAVPPKGGRPLVVSIHDAGPWLWPATFGRRGRWFHAQGARAARQRADVVLTGSHAAADEVATHIGIPPDRIRVVPYGVDPVPPPDEEVLRGALERFGLHGRRYVLWVGSLEPRKGVGTLVAALAKLPKGTATLALAGYNGWQNNSLVDAGDVEKLGGSLVRVGRVSEPDLAALYAGAALFAFPSAHEGFGLPVLEAMSAGVPVLASDIGPVREVAGDCAVFVPPGDSAAWAQALEAGLAEAGSAAAEARVVAGRERAGRYSWRATAERTLDVYRSLA